MNEGQRLAAFGRPALLWVLALFSTGCLVNPNNQILVNSWSGDVDCPSETPSPRLEMLLEPGSDLSRFEGSGALTWTSELSSGEVPWQIDFTVSLTDTGPAPARTRSLVFYLSDCVEIDLGALDVCPDISLASLDPALEEIVGDLLIPPIDPNLTQECNFLMR